jgi:hypothetical protein
MWVRAAHRSPALTVSPDNTWGEVSSLARDSVLPPGCSGQLKLEPHDGQQRARQRKGRSLTAPSRLVAYLPSEILLCVDHNTATADFLVHAVIVDYMLEIVHLVPDLDAEGVRFLIPRPKHELELIAVGGQLAVDET